MIINTASNVATSPNQSIPGKVLSVSPDGATVVVTDPIRQTVSLVTTSGGSQTVATNYGNLVGTSAAWSPDSQTVYITTTGNTLLTHSVFNNWRVVAPTDEVYTDIAVMVPSVGAYFAGPNATEGRSYCPVTTIATPPSNGNPPTTVNGYFPLADSVAGHTDMLAATTDGKHILAAAASPATIKDINITLPPPTQANAPQTCTTATSQVSINSTSNTPVPLANITASAITGVEPASNSALAFVTYDGSSGLLPFYLPGTGTVNYVQLSDGATAPVSGVFSTDDLTFYAGTSGDDQVHLISVTGTTATESGTIIAPKLPAANGTGLATPDMIVQKPKRLQS